ncbi:MAG: PAS domain S-box-containing protein [Cyclobacteriaceae bacterium]
MLIKNLINKEFDSKQEISSLLLEAKAINQQENSINGTQLVTDYRFVNIPHSFTEINNNVIVRFEKDSAVSLAFHNIKFPHKAVLFDNNFIIQTLRQITDPLDGSAYLLSDKGVFIANTDSLDKRKILAHVENLNLAEVGNNIYNDLVEDGKLLRFMTLINITESQFVVLVLNVPDVFFYDDFEDVSSVILFLTTVCIILILGFIGFASFKYTKKETEKTVVLNQLQESNAQLISFIENPGSVSIFSLDRDFRYTGFNSLHEKEMLEIFKAKVEKGAEIFPLIPDKMVQRFEENLRRALNGEHFTITSMYRNKYFSQVYNPVYSRVGNKSEIIGLTGNIFEVTEKIKAEQELEKYRYQLEELVEARTRELASQKDFFQNIIDQVPFLVFVRNRKGEYVMANKVVAKSFGFKTDYLIGKKISEAHKDPKEANIHVKQDLMILETGQVVEEENFQRYPDSADKWYFLTKKRIELDNEYFVLGVQYDITFLKQTEERLQKTNKRLQKTLQDLEVTQVRLVESEKMASIGHLMAGLAHEINNPMNYVSGNIAPIKNDLEEIKTYIRKSNANIPDHIEETFVELSELINAVDEGSGRVKGLMSDLSNFSSKSKGERTIRSILEPIQSTINLISYQIKDRISIELSYDDHLPAVNVNLASIKQVILNVLNNSIQSIAGKGEINISVSTEKAQLIIQILDSGHGITKENLPNVFNPFYTTKDVGEGTGLGLSISYKIMEEHNGRIFIDSIDQKGTTVILKLPI